MAKGKTNVQDLDETAAMGGDSELEGEEEFFINFDDIEDSTGLIEPGTYEAFISFAVKGKGKEAPFAPKIDVRWKIDDAAAVDKGAQGRIVFDTFSWHPNALPITRKKLEGLGFPATYRGRIDTEMLLGERALITIKTKKSDPSKVNRETNEPYPDKSVIARIKPLSGRTTPDDL